MTQNKKDYRIRITSGNGDYKTFITRTNGRVSFFNGSETPLALSNLARDKAAELRFELEDARSDSEAANAIRRIAPHSTVEVI